MAPQGLKSDEWRKVPLVQKENVNYNTVHLRFGLDDSATAGLNVASCLLVKAPTGGKNDDGSPEVAIRPYTPVSRPHEKGHFDLMVKVYEQGNVSKFLGDMKEGDTIEAKGPIQKLEYKPNMRKSIGLIAGGSGITPMQQLIEEIVQNPDDKTQVSLMFANTAERDILLRDRFDELAKKHDNFHVHYVLDEPPQGWTGGSGHIDQSDIKSHCPPPGEDNLVCVCGPPPMMKAISGDKNEDKSQGEVAGHLKEMGYTSDMVYKF